MTTQMDMDESAKKNTLKKIKAWREDVNRKGSCYT